MAQLNIPKFFNNEAELLLAARQECIDIHGSDIRAAGNQVEMAVREWLIRMLPTKVSVGHGHIIDINSDISPQLDCLLCDNKGFSTLFRAKDGTEYTPMDSVYAIGEIKSTFHKSQNYFKTISKNLKFIKSEMSRTLIKNTFTGELANDSLFHHILHSSSSKYLNRLFTFALFINSGDAKKDDLIEIYNNTPDSQLPSIAVFMDKFVIVKADTSEKGMEWHKYPEDAPESARWHIFEMREHAESDAKMEGKHIGVLYYLLVNHINNSLLERPVLNSYLKDLLVGSKSGTTVMNT